MQIPGIVGYGNQRLKLPRGALMDDDLRRLAGKCFEVAARRPPFEDVAMRLAAAQSRHPDAQAGGGGGGGGGGPTAAADYYEILGVEPGCSAKEIKKAYQKIALTCHPDKANKAATAQKASSLWFRTVQEAYDVLKDPAQRRQYDSKRKKG